MKTNHRPSLAERDEIICEWLLYWPVIGFCQTKRKPNSDFVIFLIGKSDKQQEDES